MRKYITFLNQYKLLIILSISIFVVLLSISLKNLSFEGSYRIWFDKDSKIIKDYDNFRATFSGDDTFVIAFEDKEGIFNPKPINTILSLAQELKMIDGVQKVDSLCNYQYISSQDDDVMVEDFIFDTQNLEEKKALALKDNLILHQLINSDATSTMIAIKLSSLKGADEEVNIYVMRKIEEMVAKYQEQTGYKFYISGLSAITASLVTIAIDDAILLIPMAVVIVVVLLFLLFRDPLGVAIPSVVIVFTFLIVLSMQMLLGHKLNNFTVNIPSFISAIAIADSMHLFLAWVYYRSKDVPNQEAVYLALKNNLIPITMTSITTAIGFATLSISAIEPIATLGVAITSGALIAFLLSITIVPAMLLFLSDSYKVKPIKFLNLLNTKGYGAFISRNDKNIVFGSAFIFIVIGYGLTFLKVDSNSIKYFGEETTVRSGSTFIEEKITGSMTYEIILDSKRKEGAKEPKFLREIVKFEKELKEKYSNVTFTTSLKDIVTRMQKVLNPNATEPIPNNQNMVAQYLLLYSMSLPQGMELNDKIDTTEEYLRLSINSNIQDTSKDLAMIAWIENWWSKNTPYSATVQGQTSIFAYMQSSVISTLLGSISATLILVLLAMFFIYKNLKMLWIFILPNILPLILVAGVMGYLGISIDIGVAISASVILGIAVDDTIHFFSKYFDAIKTMSFEESIDHVISHSGNAMILTTFILSFTFSIFGISSFVPNVNFSIVTVVALNLALLLDFVLLPAILSLGQRK